MNVALLLFFLIAIMIKESRLMAVFGGAIVAGVALGRVFIMELKRIFSTSTSAQRRHGRALFSESDEIAPTEEEKVIVLSDERRPSLEDKFNKEETRDSVNDGTRPNDDMIKGKYSSAIDGQREGVAVSRNVGRALIDALKISAIGALLAVCLLTYWTAEAYRIYPWEFSEVRHWQGFIFTPAYLLLGISLIGAIIGFVVGLCIRISGPLAMVIIFVLFTLWSFMPAVPTRNLSNYNFRLSNPDEGERIHIFPSEDSPHGSAPDTPEAVAIVDSLMTPREHYREIDWREEEWRRDRMNDYLSAARLGMAWVGDSQAVAMHFAGYPNGDGDMPTSIVSHAIISTSAIFLVLHDGTPDDSLSAIEYRIDLKRIGANWNLVWMGARFQCQPGRGEGNGWQKTLCY